MCCCGYLITNVLLTSLSHASLALVWRSAIAASTHWCASYISLLRWRLAVLLIVPIVLWRSPQLLLLLPP